MNEPDPVDEDPRQIRPGKPVTKRQQNNGGESQPELPGGRRSPSAFRGRAAERVTGVQTFFTRDLWSRELASMPTFRRFTYGVARVVHLTITNFVKDRCPSRAASLTYITVLSLVPMLALGFSVAKGLGAYETLLTKSIVPFLDSTFGPAEELGSLVVDALNEDGGEATTDEVASATGEPAAGETAETADAEGTPGGTPGGTPESTEESAAAPVEAPPNKGGSEVRRAIDTVLGFVQQTDVSRLGALGLLIVIWTVIQLLGAVERAFNDIWGVTKSRSLPRKLADYLSTIVLVPVLLVTGTGVMSAVRGGWLSDYIGGGDSYLFAQFSSLMVIWIGFAFAYILMPNIRTRVSSALIGGVVGGTMWQLFQFAHVKLQVGVANYNAIYSTFAALPIFLFWVHSSWMTVLIGAEAAAAHQNQARHGQLVRSRNFDLALKETIALRLAVRVTHAFLDGAPPKSMEYLADELSCPDRTLEEVTRMLTRARVLAMVEMDGDEPGVVLASDPDLVRMQDVLDALKGDALDDETLKSMQAFQGADEAVGEAFSKFRRVLKSAPENSTLRELANA